MTNGIVGRDEELSSVNAFFDRKVEGPTAIVLEGEAGIGKSTLWLAGVAAAQARGFRVLAARPAEAERGLAHAGLGDLFEDPLESVLPNLSGPRRRALEIALLIEEGQGSSDPRTLGVAVRSVLDVLTAETPLVLAIDDVQWLDRSSASALSFALRRVSTQPILLLARRLGEGAEVSELEQAIDREHVARLPVGPLSLGATHQLLHTKLGRQFPRPTLLRVHEAAGGNPFYALELARVLRDDLDPTQPLRVPETLEELVRARLDELPKATRQALLLVSALGSPRARLVLAAGITEKQLDPALDAHVIERSNDLIRFTHPLLASVLYQSMSAETRRRTHGRVASVVDDPLDHARHVALSTESPDADVAAMLEAASSSARARAAPIAAAELGELALRLTPTAEDGDRQRRALAVARAHGEAGEWGRARTILEEILARTAAGPERAEALLVLHELESLDRAIALLYEALEQAATRPVLQAAIHQRLAGYVRLTAGTEQALKHARASVELAERVGDDALRASALAVLTLLQFDVGDPDAPRLAEQAHEAALADGDPNVLRESTVALVHVLVWSVETARARALLESELREWYERDEYRSCEAMWMLSFVELDSGRWPLAAEYAERAEALASQYGAAIPQLFFPVALIAAHRGEFDRAREAARRGRELAAEQGAGLAGLVSVPGLVDFWDGDPAAAVTSFAAAEQTADARGWREPNMRLWRADYIEALLELGQHEEALELLDAWEASAAIVGRERVLAQATRCRGLVAAAKGDVEQARLLLERATARHQAVGDQFGRARALLALGIVTRRARQKRAAREAIEAALEGFERLGAASWAKTARAELGRVGGRTRSDGLTPAELRVANLVAEGHTNREVADTLFLGERTVASHLTHIYAKLGVRSRTELARRLQ